MKLKRSAEKKFWGVVFVAPWILGFCLFFAYPLVESFWFAFNNVKPSSDGLIVEFVKFQQFKNAFRVNVSFTGAWIGSIRDLAINLPIITIFSLLLAVVLNGEFKGRTFARAVFFIPVIFNSEAITTAMGGGEALRTLMEQNGLGLSNAFNFEAYLIQANLAPGLVTFLIGSVDRIYDIVSLSGVQILLFLAGIQSIPGHLYEAAKIEGATQYEIFWKITLPMVSPMIIPATVYTIVDSFLTLPVATVIDNVTGDLNYGLAAAMSWIYFGTIAVILAVILGLLSKVVFYYDK